MSSVNGDSFTLFLSVIYIFIIYLFLLPIAMAEISGIVLNRSGEIEYPGLSVTPWVKMVIVHH